MPAIAAYLVAAGSILFAASSALTWIYLVRHIDPPELDSDFDIGVAQPF